MAVTFQKQVSTDEELYELLHPLVRKWFKSKFPSFGPPQKYAIMDIHSRKNTLISAPTGSGKTLTAFLSILNELVDAAEKGILEEKVYAVYLSPLKALNNDIERNLLEPLKELNEIAGKELGIRVAVRTGDTTPYQKQKMVKKPPHIFITTPESLGIVLSSSKFSERLHAVDWVIVDEIHSLAESKRGVHLSLSLERLQRLSPGLCRIGLSATVAPIDEVAQFLVGTERDVLVVDVQFVKEYDLQVQSPVKNLVDTPHFVMQNALYKKLHAMVQKHTTTLIFTNTRAGTERVIDNLKNRYPKCYTGENTGAHHGSMGKRTRLEVENALREGKLKLCSSSTSLELGIDIGKLDLVICLGSPKSVARFLQRVGRAGHNLYDTVKGRLIVMGRDDLVECSVLLKNAVEKKIDRIHIPRGCLDVLAQQIAGIALEQVWEEKELFKLIKQSYCYSNLTKKSFNEILQYLSGEFVDLQERYVFGKIWRNEGKIGKRGKMARVIYMTNIGTIPSQSHITVKIGDQIIGKLDEKFLEKLRPGDVFTLGGAMYQFRYARGMTAQVRASPTRPPTVPSWVSEQLPLSFDLASDIAKFRRLMNERFKKKRSKEEITSFVHEYLYVDENAADAIYQYFNEQFKYSVIPHDKLMLIEEVHDDDGVRFIFHSVFGRRVNDCLSRAMGFIVGRKIKKDVEVGVNDNGFFIAGAGKLQVKEILSLLKAERLDLLMSAALEKTEIYRRRFRHCAERSLMILRNYAGRRKSVGRSHMSSQLLMSALLRIDPDFSILKEAKREVLEDLMDIQNAKKVVAMLEKGILKVKHVKTTLPSPFAFTIALQGRLDVMKMEDKHDFLRRMHQYVLAKIGQHGEIDIPEQEAAEQDPYEELWRKEQEHKEEREQDEKVKLMEDARKAIKRLRLPRDILMDLYSLIDGQESGFRQDFLIWLEQTFTKVIPKAVSDDLAKFVKSKRGKVW